MTVSMLDTKTALLVVDLQKGVVGLPTAHPIDGVIKNAVALTEAFRKHALPVVFINVDGRPPGRTEQPRPHGGFPSGWSDLIAELQRQPGDHIVTKQTWGAFTNTGLGKHLGECGITQVVIAGVATSGGVESTARQAHELGFNVALTIDAMTDTNADAHHNSIARIFPRLGETGTTQQLLDLLDALPSGTTGSA